MTNRIEIPEYLRSKIIVKLVTRIHVEPIIRAVGIVSLIHLVNGMPVKKEKIAADV